MSFSPESGLGQKKPEGPKDRVSKEIKDKLDEKIKGFALRVLNKLSNSDLYSQDSKIILFSLNTAIKEVVAHLSTGDIDGMDIGKLRGQILPVALMLRRQRIIAMGQLEQSTLDLEGILNTDTLLRELTHPTEKNTEPPQINH